MTSERPTPALQPASPQRVRVLPFRAAATAAAITAQHVVVKATRDALFLSQLGARHLPYAFVGAAVLSGASALLFSRLMTKHGPARLVGPLLATSAAALIGVRIVALPWAQLAALLLYAQVAIFGALAMSAFWSAVSEAFDPHRGRQAIARVAAGSALGAVGGGILAWQAARCMCGASMLLCAAALQLLAACGAGGLSRKQGDARTSEGPPSTTRVMRSTRYLRLLAGLVALVAASDALFELALSSNAAERLHSEARLLPFFAAFQTTVGLLSFALQTAVARRALDRLGVGGTAAILPAAALLGGIAGAAMHRLAVTAVIRSAQASVQASLHRSAYEVLYTPLPAALKRPTKTLIDVGYDRLGTLAGGLLAMVVLAVAPKTASVTAFVVGAGLAVATLVVVRRVQFGYVSVLAANLRSGAVRLEPASVVDRTTRTTLSVTSQTINRSEILRAVADQQTLRLAAHHVRHSSDEQLRGNALEYLHEALPKSACVAVWANLAAPDGDQRRS